MFASRFFVPAFRTATRSFTASSSSRTPFLYRQTLQRTYAWRAQLPRTRWQNAFRQAHQKRSASYGRRPFNYQRFQASSNLFKRWAAQPTFYYQVGGIGVVISTVYVSNLEEVPISGRRRFRIVSSETEAQMGKQMYQQTMQEFGGRILPPFHPKHRMVQRVLDRLIPASGLGDEAWEVHVIEDPMTNAFVIPGGKVFVFSGILDVCENDDGLAAVLGHEIAHNVAHHAAERMSQSFIVMGLGFLASLASGVDPGIGNMVLDLAFLRPGSRAQESEADHIGLLMMAESCYDPEAAAELWERMEKQGDAAPPQFLSTHPSNHNRMEMIRNKWMHDAEMRRENAGCGGMSGFADDFRKTVNF